MTSKVIWTWFTVLIASLAHVAAFEGHNVAIGVDLGKTHEISDLLYGIFFEEINHAGEGGLYGELIQDRSFDALAYTTGFGQKDGDVLELMPEHFETKPLPKSGQVSNETMGAELRESAQLKAKIIRERANFINQPNSWRPLNTTKASLTTTDPLTVNNRISMKVTATNAGGGLANSGYWGVPINGGWIYYFSVYIKGDKHAKVRVSFESADGSKTYGHVHFGNITHHWQKFSANITSNTTDFDGIITLRLEEPGSILVDSLSLFPGGSIKPDFVENPYPFREDLLQHLKDLKPRFLRFPGGCYVEGGDWLRNRFPWKTNLGLYENRTGHLNDVWGYWSTDGLGLYEYMLLADELNAEPIYVVNNGISHMESTLPADIQPFIDETMDALEFLTGPKHSFWGSERARMGHKKPWKINYLAIGNEDCGRPYYVENYNAFYSAIKALYPHITLISNCPLGDAGPTELWDWHSYDNSWTMFNRMHDFDSLQRGSDPPVFVSEYAVIADGGWGNLRGAVAEASFMTGLERNSDIVKLASYAPLFVHRKNRIWPTNMIVFDNHRSYKTPSYLVQELFSNFVGVLSAATDVKTGLGDLHNELVAASATCQDSKCEKVAVKAANYNSYAQPVTIAFRDSTSVAFEDDAVLHHVSGDHAEAENSFENTENVKLAQDNIKLSGSTIVGKAFRFEVTLPPNSASVIELTRKQQPSTS